ncbi:redoxin domain-containing protein [Jannaschia sp. S6380]|uniref:peroxiredoxin family protein n=1 Tax=Jannaschia sp. S6380 TaxID=2926408 RepID=UPI001FF55F72|nr:peroxiredoxin family protein [Jannaschia sp. S6380]MCK0168213.1 redoxin domain-containing protein [Jannaschia sp. S6380]
MSDTATMPLPGRRAPDLHLELIIGAEWDLADQSPGAFTMIVFYRGLHCPICKAYLSDLRGMYDDFLSKGVEVVNVSMDAEERAREAHEEWGLEPIPMAHSLTEDQARAWGLYLSAARSEKEPDVFAEPGLFLVKPDGTLYMAEMSSAPFVRPDLKLLLSKLDFIADKDYPPRGTHRG